MEVEVKVDDVIKFPITRYERHQAGEAECTGFVNQLFPELATSSSMDNDLDVDLGGIDVDDQIPPRPTSLLSDIFPHLDPVTELDSGPASTTPSVSGSTEESFTITPVSTDNTEIGPTNEVLAPDSDSGLASTPLFLSSGESESLIIGTPISVDNQDIAAIDESQPKAQIDAVDSESSQDRSRRSSRHRLEELWDWASNVLVILERDGDDEEMEHLEWTWELIKQFHLVASLAKNR